MSGGLVATVAAIVILLMTYLFGKKEGKDSTTTKISGEVTIQRQKAVQAETEADLLKEVAPAVSETAAWQAVAEAEYEQTLANISKASRASDMDAMKAIAQAMAEKALRMGATSKGGDR